MSEERNQIRGMDDFCFSFLLCQVEKLPCQSGMKVITVLMKSSMGNFA
jgi:hypothetical protein